MDRCLLCGRDPAQHSHDCPDAAWAGSRSVFVDADEVARGRAALERDEPLPVLADEMETEDADEPTVPWAIPIRDAAVVSTRAARPPADAEQRRLVGLVVGGLVLVVVALVGASLIGGDSGAAPDTEVAGSEVTRTPDDDPAGVDAATSTSAPASTSSVTEAPATTDTTAAPTTTTTAPAPVSDDTGDVPILSPGEIGRGWVAQVSSVPQRSGGQALQTAYATVSRSAPDAVAIRSDQWPAMQSGFWVIVVPDYPTGADALEGCDRAGNGDCFGRYLSAIADQNARTCRRTDGGGREGDCGA